MRKILIISNHPDYTYNFRKEIIYSLLAEKNEVIIACPYGEKIDILSEHGCKFIPIDYDRHGKNLLFEIQLFLRYYKLIKRQKPDTVLTYTIKPNIYGGMASQLLKTPHIANITGLGSSMQSNLLVRKGIVLLHKLSFKKTHTIFFQNKDNYNFFKEKQIQGKYNLIIPGSGVNVNDFPYAPYPKNKTTLITYSGRIMKNKGIYELLDAIEKINEMKLPVKFRFIGFIEKDSKLEKLFYKICDIYDVEYFGYTKNIYKYLSETDAVILPSYSEGMSNSLLEAGCTGRALLASDIPGCQEIIDHKKTGYLFRKKSSDAIVDAVLQFLNLTHEEKEKMGLKSRKKIMKDFDRSIIVRKYNKQINKLEDENEKINN